MSDPTDDLFKLAQGLIGAAKKYPKFAEIFNEAAASTARRMDRVEPVDIEKYLANVTVHDVGTGIPADLAEALRMINQHGRKYGINVQFLVTRQEPMR